MTSATSTLRSNLVSERRPSVLFIGVGSPWTGGAGYLVRESMLLQALSRLDVDLHVAAFTSGDDPPPPPFRATVSVLPDIKHVQETRWQAWCNDLFRSDPTSIRWQDCQAAREAVALLRPERFDAVVCYRCDFAHGAGVLGHRNLILDIDDPEHLRRAAAARWTDDGNWAWQRALDLRRLKRFEIDCARRAKACFVCQDRDAHPFRAAGIEPVIVPNCVEVQAVCPPRRAASPNVLFVGNMHGSELGPNVDAMRWLTTDIWPRVRRQMPEAQCLLAGPIRGRHRERASQVAGVQVLGFVDDLKPLLAEASASLAPIRFGTGTRIKILEAMAHGCPVVSTRKGAEGLDVQDGRDILIADSADEFAAACVRLMRDPAEAERIGRAGWQAVSERYSRSGRESWLAEVFARLIGLPAGMKRQVA